MAVSEQNAEAGALDADDGRESEWQLSAPDLNRVRQWLTTHSAVDGFVIESRPAQSIYDTYLDTEDWRIHRAGFALRLRDRPGIAEATLKDLVPNVSGFVSRREINQALGTAEEACLTQGSGPVSSRLQAVTGARPLRPLFRVRTHRELFAVLVENRETGEIALDETLLASADGRSKVQLRRVEVEMLSAQPQSLQALVDRLRTECALQPATHSKFEVGLNSSGLTLPATKEWGASGTDPVWTLADAARGNLRLHFARWLTCEPAARSGDDPEHLEGLCRATRGLLHTLRTFEAQLPHSWRKLRRRLKSMSHHLEILRELDEALRDLDSFVAGQGGTTGQSLQMVRQQAVAEKLEAHGQMLEVLDRTSTRRLLGRLGTELSGSSFESGDTVGSAMEAATSRLIAKEYKKLRERCDRLTKASPVDQLGELRRRVERLLETMSTVANLYGDPAGDMSQALRKLESLLWTIESTERAGNRLRGRVSGEPSMASDTAFSLGIYCEQLSARSRVSRRQLPKVMGKLHGRRWKALRKVLENPCGQNGKDDEQVQS